ncbi:GNAT family protein [Cellulomonas sp.]|uniref:GNAT family N-acetyltransferase n=1 Tax=Cellulomonas sp. TaxID=40001 RepID=UPI0028125C39|nr:GNAT family protein [Cellulomonas sp.]
MARVRLLTATASHLSALLRSPQDLSALLGVPVPAGWPEFPEAVPATLRILTEHPGQAPWWMHLFLDADSGLLVGSGGFAGPPVDRTVEVGYEIAPEHRRCGFATAAVRALLAAAAASGEVDRVVAHTRDGDERSGGVLRAAGFAQVARVEHPEEGTLLRWERDVPGPGE